MRNRIYALLLGAIGLGCACWGAEHHEPLAVVVGSVVVGVALTTRDSE